MDEREEARRQRALQRASWSIQKFKLGEEPEDDLSHLTVAERVAMVWRVTQDAWASSGMPLPTYTRAEIPGRMIRKHEQ